MHNGEKKLSVRGVLLASLNFMSVDRTFAPADIIIYAYAWLRPKNGRVSVSPLTSRKCKQTSAVVDHLS